jgi:hypothetical protein
LEFFGATDPSVSSAFAEIAVRILRIRTGMICELRLFNPNLTVDNDARERLGAALRPLTNAVL